MTNRRALRALDRSFAKSLAVASMFAAAAALAAVPVGYRYVGSRAVSEGRAVFWYWHVDYVEIGVTGASFVARMYARAVDVNQERPYVAEVRCDTRSYREFGGGGRWETTAEGEPIAAVMRAGCDGARAVSLAERNARLGAAAVPLSVPAGVAERATSGAIGAPAPAIAKVEAPKPVPPPAAPREEPADPRRADQCVRFAEAKGMAAGDATVTNTCAFPVELSLCYKGGKTGLYDCPAAARGKRSDSLGPGITHVLPEYRRTAHRGIALVACKGTMGSVFPRLDDAGGRSGCF